MAERVENTVAPIGISGAGLRPDVNSPITFVRLRKLNRIATTLHFVQFLFMLIASIAVEQFAEFRLPITKSVLRFKDADDGGGFYTEVTTLTNIKIAPFVAIFFLLSALFQGITTVGKYNDVYNAQIRSGINYFRWYEYSLSSSVMIVIIAMFTGAYDWALLLCIFALNATMNLFGLLMEQINQTRTEVSWLSFIYGCVCGLPPWIIVFVGLFSGDSPPGFVYGIFVAYLIMFNTFPVNMILQYKKFGKWADYMYGELIYIVLSLVAKTLLGWLVFGGLNQPNNFTGPNMPSGNTTMAL